MFYVQPVDFFLSLLFYYTPTKLHVLIHSLLFSAFSAIEVLGDKGENRCTLRCTQASRSHVALGPIKFCDILQ